jgi:hypothetical protein
MISSVKHAIAVKVGQRGLPCPEINRPIVDSWVAIEVLSAGHPFFVYSGINAGRRSCQMVISNCWVNKLRVLDNIPSAARVRRRAGMIE